MTPDYRPAVARKVAGKFCLFGNHFRPVSAFGPSIFAKDGLERNCRDCVKVYRWAVRWVRRRMEAAA